MAAVNCATERGTHEVYSEAGVLADEPSARLACAAQRDLDAFATATAALFADLRAIAAALSA
jgi:hypothetical protein